MKRGNWDKDKCVNRSLVHVIRSDISWTAKSPSVNSGTAERPCPGRFGSLIFIKDEATQNVRTHSKEQLYLSSRLVGP